MSNRMTWQKAARKHLYTGKKLNACRGNECCLYGAFVN